MFPERARSFGSQAAAYDRGRPAYPREALVWLLGDRPLAVLDIGAGTGKLTGVLVDLGHAVTAIEPDPAMLGTLRESGLPVAALSGSAESIPAAGGAFDAVVSGQAFHWFDPAAALPEIARVLRPGGVLGLLWNMRDTRVPWLAALSDVLDAAPRQIYDPGRLTELFAHAPPFSPAEQAEFAYEQPIDLDTLLEAVRSRSSVILLEPAERDRLLARVSALWAAHPGIETMPYVTETFRVRRLADPAG